MSEMMLTILLFEGVACCLLAAVFVSRWFFRQPIDRIRITQLGFGLVIIAAICIGCGIGPTITLSRYSAPDEELSEIVPFAVEEFTAEVVMDTQVSIRISLPMMRESKSAMAWKIMRVSCSTLLKSVPPPGHALSVWQDSPGENPPNSEGELTCYAMKQDRGVFRASGNC